MSHIYMIRHGKPAATWGQASDGDPGLDETGRTQARAVRDLLLALPDRPRSVVSSPLLRCRETAQPFAEALGLQPQIDARFGEVPTPAALAPEERPGWLRRAFAGRWSEIKGDLDYEAWRRAVADALLEHPGAAVFSHYVAINAAISMVTGRDEVLCFRPDHTSITTFEIENGHLRLAERGREAETQVL
jgi:broad specificity phosphatase PhoE